MNEKVINKCFDRLKAVRWGSACKWNSTARDHILDYYEKVLPFWPEDRVKLFPHNSILIESFSIRLTATEVEQTNLMLQKIIKTAEDSGFVVTSMGLALAGVGASVEDRGCHYERSPSRKSLGEPRP